MREIKKEVLDEPLPPEKEDYQLYFLKVEDTEEDTEDDSREYDEGKMTTDPLAIPGNGSFLHRLHRK